MLAVRKKLGPKPSISTGLCSASMMRRASESRRMPRDRRFDDDHELVAAVAADGVVRADHVLEPFGDDLQELVAGLLAELLVDVLEPVDVDEQRADHDRRSCVPRGRACARRGRASRPRLGRPGERVVEVFAGRGRGSRRDDDRSGSGRGRRRPSTSAPARTLASSPVISSAIASPWSPTAARGRRGEGPQRPAAAVVDVVVTSGSARRRAVGVDVVGAAGAVAQAGGAFGQAAHRLREQHGRREHLADPAGEGGAAARVGAREHVAAVDRRQDFERLAAAGGRDVLVEALAAVAGREQRVVRGADVEAAGGLRGGAAPDGADRQAFEGAPVRGQLGRGGRFRDGRRAGGGGGRVVPSLVVVVARAACMGSRRRGRGRPRVRARAPARSG